MNFGAVLATVIEIIGVITVARWLVNGVLYIGKLIKERIGRI